MAIMGNLEERKRHCLFFYRLTNDMKKTSKATIDAEISKCRNGNQEQINHSQRVKSLR